MVWLISSKPEEINVFNPLSNSSWNRRKEQKEKNKSMEKTKD